MYVIHAYKGNAYMGLATEIAFASKEAGEYWIYHEADKAFRYELHKMEVYDMATVKAIWPRALRP